MAFRLFYEQFYLCVNTTYFLVAVLLCLYLDWLPIWILICCFFLDCNLKNLTSTNTCEFPDPLEMRNTIILTHG
uniref:Uncharacterized protein n=1 Tax=Arundo donax TaxID=35708 RepID=A0A0A9BG09_ARUDO